MMSALEVQLAAAVFQEEASSAGNIIPVDVVEAGMTAAVAAVTELRTHEAVARALLASRPAPALDAGQYKLLMAQECTVSLEQFRAMEEFDPNVFWRLDSGHHQNLLDTALEHIDVLSRALEAAKADTADR